MNPILETTHWYFSKRTLPYWGILTFDCIILFFSALFVYILNNGVFYSLQHFWPLCTTVLFYMIFYLLGFRLFHTYSGIVRFSSFIDLQRIGYACLIGLSFTILFKYLLADYSWPIALRLRDIIIWNLVAVSLMWAMRVVVKYLYDTYYRSKDAERVFIFGVQQGGISIAKSIRNQDPAKYRVEGFITDEKLDASMLMGVNVYHVDDNTCNLMVKKHIKALFVSPLRSDSLRNNQDFVNSLVSAGIKIYMIPAEQEWDGKKDFSHQILREVDIEDLLPREKIEVDMGAIATSLANKRILITGAAGSIGSEMVRQVAKYNPSELVLIDQAETPLHDIRLMMAKSFPEIKAFTIVADIAHKSRMREIFNEHKPEFVFHAAAYKHVPMMEDNPAESIQNNVEGTRIIADLAVEYGTRKFVMISTDKAVNPTNVMGCSKRICEIYVQSLDKAIKDGKIKGNTQFVTTRFGNVLGSNGSVIPLFRQQIKNGGPVTVTHPNIIRYFMLIPEACKLVLEAGTMGHGGEIFVFDMGQPVKIVDLAKRMILLSGVDVEIKFTGLRDGEKLYEEVLNDEEITLPTFHPKIKIAKVREYEYEQVNASVQQLFNCSLSKNSMEIVRLMKVMVPEYKSQNSVYESLDK